MVKRKLDKKSKSLKTKKILGHQITSCGTKTFYFIDHSISTLFRMVIFGAADGWRERGGGVAKRPPLPKICHTFPTMMKLDTVIPYLKKIQETYQSRDSPPGFWHFLTRNQPILLYQEMQI